MLVHDHYHEPQCPSFLEKPFMSFTSGVLDEVTGDTAVIRCRVMAGISPSFTT